MLSKFISIFTVLSAGALALGCSSSRDVEVTGQVSSASAQGQILLEFFDVDGADKTSVHTAKADSRRFVQSDGRSLGRRGPGARHRRRRR